MKAVDLLVEFYDPQDDEFNRANMDDTRRPRLTMLHLQRLRKAKDVEQYDKLQHLDFLPDMYAPPEQPPA